MSLSAGQTLTHYEILEPLGKGGMGEVWRARDGKLGREVAIKVLPDAFVHDEDRLRRFEREARSLAQLNHGNVAGIYGVDQVGDTCFLALELVPGEDLAQRLARGPLPTAEALDVCRQIAEGLEAAHEAGVVHRDLKPANVRITDQGTVKLLDFGLAKPMGAADDGTTTQTDSFLMTEEGVVMGTPTYMSPEQARGKAVDRRTDVWALGCVLFECLTGARAFHGQTMPDIFAAIVDREPAWELLPADTPPAVTALLRRALEKDPRTRLRDAGEARVLLARVRRDPLGGWGGMPGVGAGAGGDGASDDARGRGPLALVVTALLALVVGAAGMRLLGPETTSAPGTTAGERPFAGAGARDGPGAARVAGAAAVYPERRFTVLDESAYDYGEAALGGRATVLLSPDGDAFAVRSGGRIFMHTLDGSEPREVVVDRDLRPSHLDWSEDGGHLVFSSRKTLYRVPSTGGRVTKIADLEDEVRSLAVLGQRVAFRMGDERVFVVPLHGGEPALYGDPLPEDSHWDFLRPMHGTDLLMGIRHDLTVTEGMGKWLRIQGPETAQDVLDLELEDERFALVGGHLVLQRDDRGSPTLFAIPFSVDELRVTGEPVRLWPGSHPRTNRRGDLLYRETAAEGRVQLAWLDRDGGLEPVGAVGRDIEMAFLSDDERRAVYMDGPQVWVLDLQRGVPSLVYTLDTNGFMPQFLPSGRVIVHVGMTGISLLPRGPGKPTPWSVRGVPMWIAPDGSRALIFDFEEYELREVDLADDMPVGPPRTVRRLEAPASISPDGEWLIYSSDHSGEDQNYVARIDDEDQLWPLGYGRGSRAQFGFGGREILFDSEDGTKLMRMSFTPGPEPRFGDPVEIIDSEEAGLTRRMMGWPGDERLLVPVRLDPTETTLVLVENWSGPGG